jgi:MFS family permease
VSLIYGAGFLGTFSPWFAGYLVDRFGIHSAFLYGGAVSLLATAMLVFLRLPKTARQMEQASG